MVPLWLMHEQEVITGFGEKPALSKPTHSGAAAVSAIGTLPGSSHHSSSEIQTPRRGLAPADLIFTTSSPSLCCSRQALTPAQFLASHQLLLCWDHSFLTGQLH